MTALFNPVSSPSSLASPSVSPSPSVSREVSFSERIFRISELTKSAVAPSGETESQGTYSFSFNGTLNSNGVISLDAVSAVIDSVECSGGGIIRIRTNLDSTMSQSVTELYPINAIIVINRDLFGACVLQERDLDGEETSFDRTREFSDAYLTINSVSGSPAETVIRGAPTNFLDVFDRASMELVHIAAPDVDSTTLAPVSRKALPEFQTGANLGPFKAGKGTYEIEQGVILSATGALWKPKFSWEFLDDDPISIDHNVTSSKPIEFGPSPASLAVVAFGGLRPQLVLYFPLFSARISFAAGLEVEAKVSLEDAFSPVPPASIPTFAQCEVCHLLQLKAKSVPKDAKFLLACYFLEFQDNTLVSDEKDCCSRAEQECVIKDDEKQCFAISSSSVPITDSTTLFPPEGVRPPESTILSPPDDGETSSIYTDPHLRTFDGLYFACQASGEFIVVMSQSFGLQIQARSSGPNSRGSVTTAIAMRQDGFPMLQISIAQAESSLSTPVGGCPLSLYVNGEAKDIANVAAGNGAEVSVASSRVSLRLGSGVRSSFRLRKSSVFGCFLESLQIFLLRDVENGNRIQQRNWMRWVMSRLLGGGDAGLADRLSCSTTETSRSCTLRCLARLSSSMSTTHSLGTKLLHGLQPVLMLR
ncbi:hypothetical protein FGB62_75g023 [Gracilaria domingensis]|nr:hypothetical protein FGB62_75g023 [Gracilaria domingensis]